MRERSSTHKNYKSLILQKPFELYCERLFILLTIASLVLSQTNLNITNSPTFKNFKNIPSSAPNASSLFSSKLRFDSKSDSCQPLRRFVSLAPEGVLAKNAVRIFFTPEPKTKSTQTSALSQSLASNLVFGGNLSLASGTKDINITGSNISSTNRDLNLTALGLSSSILGQC